MATIVPAVLLFAVACLCIVQQASCQPVIGSSSVAGSPEKPTTKCEYYNETLCNESGSACNITQECEHTDTTKKAHCYSLWQNNTGTLVVKMKGCWLNNMDCQDKKQCMSKEESKKNLYFCCCEGDMCNRDGIVIEIPTVTSPQASSTAEKPLEPDGSMILRIVLYTLFPLLLVSIIVVMAFYLYRRRQMAYFNEVPTADPSPMPPDTPLLGLRPVQLIEIKARGRFGAVWKAQMLNEYVAVKIFPVQDKQSWLVEQEIYCHPQMKHENLLGYIGAEKRGDNLLAEYWLITAFHEKGSLCDYLKANLVTWAEVCHIAESMAKGLMHLHEELPPTKGENCKPAIAHRDFKSKNVLLKQDLTACVADFGLALVFVPGQSPGDTHGQVGTRRYMAPEVLEGAINFQRDAFLRIDMYACGLVLWELMSRCTAQEGPVEEYSLPFEDEVGQHPSLEDMQDVVVHKKLRPKFKELWKKNQAFSLLCDTIEECWDHDAEARLSASCVQERISHLSRSCPNGLPRSMVTSMPAATTVQVPGTVNLSTTTTAAATTTVAANTYAATANATTTNTTSSTAKTPLLMAAPSPTPPTFRLPAPPKESSI